MFCLSIYSHSKIANSIITVAHYILNTYLQLSRLASLDVIWYEPYSLQKDTAGAESVEVATRGCTGMREKTKNTRQIRQAGRYDLAMREG